MMQQKAVFLLLGISGIFSKSNLTLICYDVIESTTEIGEVDAMTNVWEISGLTHNNNYIFPIYYGISDTILHDFPKRIFSFSIQTVDDKPSITASNIDGVKMGEPDNYPLYTADTESVVYLEDDDENKFFIVSTEGYRKYSTFTNFWLYNDTGHFLGNLSYSVETFQEQGTHDDPTYGFPDGDGVESMSATSDYSTVIFIGSHGLVQDDCASCVRISVNQMDYSGSAPTWTETAQYIYDTEDQFTRVTDATIVTSDLGSVIVLERKYYNTSLTFDTKAYEISLTDLEDSEYDVKWCRVYDSSCSGFGNVVPKTFVRDFADFADIPFIDSLHFDAIAAGSGHEGCDGGRFMMAVTDNDEVYPTIFAYLCFRTDSTDRDSVYDRNGADTLFTVISTAILFASVMYTC